MSTKQTNPLLRIIAHEVMAYTRFGLTRAPVRQNHHRSTDLGVLFVHGFGATSAQFSQMKTVLMREVDWFDAFEYHGLHSLGRHAKDLERHIIRARSRCRSLLVVGHSLGGLLLRMVLQGERVMDHVTGFVSICAPLSGSHLSRMAPLSGLRSLHPTNRLFEALSQTAHRLEGKQILTVGVERDHFIAPAASAFLEGHPRLLIKDRGHVSALLDQRVHDAVLKMARRIKFAAGEPEGVSDPH